MTRVQVLPMSREGLSQTDINSLLLAAVRDAPIDLGASPQALAVILRHLPVAVAAGVLDGLPSASRRDVALAMATTDRTSPAVLDQVKRLVNTTIDALCERYVPDPYGVSDLANLLVRVRGETEQDIMRAIRQAGPELAADVTARMVQFEDLALLEDRESRPCCVRSSCGR